MGRIITSTFEETQVVGEKIVDKLHGKNILALHGDLGSGKTTFVQGVAKGLGIKQKIISPTFIIVRAYEIPKNTTKQQFNNFYHIDLYRVENENHLSGLGLREILNDPSNVIAIEWPEKAKTFLTANKMNIYFEYIDVNRRSIEIV